jgi:hypothetical protein
MQFEKRNVVVTDDGARELFHRDIIVSPVIRVKAETVRIADLKHISGSRMASPF